MMYTAFCDGACLVHTTKCGGVGVKLYSPTDEPLETFSAHYCNTTNNRMEITAVLVALELVTGDIFIATDSMYVVGTLMQGWKRNVNNDLWDEVDSRMRGRTVEVCHYPRNSTHDLADVDSLANRASRRKCD